MKELEQNSNLKFLKPLLQDLFTIDAVYQHGHRIAVALSYRYAQEESIKHIDKRLRLAGYDYDLTVSNDNLTLTIDPRRKLRIPLLNIILFLATLGTVYILPVFLRFAKPELSSGENWEIVKEALSNGAGIEFTLGLISILFVHEMGHFVAARRRGIITSWPFFIPAPNIIGTFGAVIRSHSPFWNRRDLIEVGASGPIAGWIVAIFWLIYGLTQSVIIPSGSTQPDQITFLLDGESILMRFLVPIFVGNPLSDQMLILSEAAFAGWVGLLVTALNLLPVGQFDGGHIVYGLMPKLQKKLGWLTVLVLLYLGMSWPGWWLFAILGTLFKVAHPPTLEDHRPISRAAKIMGIVSILIMLVSLTPKPFG